MPTSSLSPEQPPLSSESILVAARPFLRRELETVHPNLPKLVSLLCSVGAGECWHKHGSFLDHLMDVHKILKLWKCPEAVCFCGLFHSAYSNSYVDLAIFDASTSRDIVRGHVGDAAERLIHLFCTVPRQPLIHDNLLFHYSDEELVQHLQLSELSLAEAQEKGVFNSEDKWRKKLQSILPSEGVHVKHIKTGEDVLVSRRVVALFVLMTVADFSNHLFGFQDILFENENGRLQFGGDNAFALWPGEGKPGLWMNSLSRMCALYNLIAREEEIFIAERKGLPTYDRDEEIELVIPPVFGSCTKVLDADEQIMARDMYWEAVCNGGKTENGLEKSEELLVRSIQKNPFVGEPRVVLSQIYLSKGRFEEAEIEADKGLALLLEWGSPWDKRMSWEGWAAWARVLLMKAREKSWPKSCWGIRKLGLVK